MNGHHNIYFQLTVTNIYKLAENYAQIVCPFSCDVMDITLIAKRKKTNNFSIRK
jgi:hypothetical protein